MVTVAPGKRRLLFVEDGARNGGGRGLRPHGSADVTNRTKRARTTEGSAHLASKVVELQNTVTNGRNSVTNGEWRAYFLRHAARPVKLA